MALQREDDEVVRRARKAEDVLQQLPRVHEASPQENDTTEDVKIPAPHEPAVQGGVWEVRPNSTRARHAHEAERDGQYA